MESIREIDRKVLREVVQSCASKIVTAMRINGIEEIDVKGDFFLRTTTAGTSAGDVHLLWIEDHSRDQGGQQAQELTRGLASIIGEGTHVAGDFNHWVQCATVNTGIYFVESVPAIVEAINVIVAEDEDRIKEASKKAKDALGDL